MSDATNQPNKLINQINNYKEVLTNLKSTYMQAKDGIDKIISEIYYGIIKIIDTKSNEICDIENYINKKSQYQFPTATIILRKAFKQ